jgi:hypothetical protein
MNVKATKKPMLSKSEQRDQPTLSAIKRLCISNWLIIQHRNIVSPKLFNDTALKMRQSIEARHVFLRGSTTEAQAFIQMCSELQSHFGATITAKQAIEIVTDKTPQSLAHILSAIHGMNRATAKRFNGGNEEDMYGAEWDYSSLFPRVSFWNPYESMYWVVVFCFLPDDVSQAKLFVGTLELEDVEPGFGPLLFVCDGNMILYEIDFEEEGIDGSKADNGVPHA